MAGQAGAARAIEIYRDELDRLLALIGCRDIAELDREFLVLPEGFDAAAKVLDTPQLRPRALP